MLHEQSKNDKVYVKKITDSYELFEEKINIYIDEMCNTYLGLNKIDDISEW